MILHYWFKYKPFLYGDGLPAPSEPYKVFGQPGYYLPGVEPEYVVFEDPAYEVFNVTDEFYCEAIGINKFVRNVGFKFKVKILFEGKK